MKKQLSKKALWQSLLSIGVLGIFLVLATGTTGYFLDVYEAMITKEEYLGDGKYKTTTKIDENADRIMTGTKDIRGRWQGETTREIIRDGFVKLIEEVNMVDGKRDGISKTTRRREGKEDIITEECYKMGKKVSWIYCEEAARKSMAVVSSFQVLSNNYPWFLYTLNAFDFENEYVEAYMDTLETVLATYEFEDLDFDAYYQQVIDSLGETVYDSIIALNSILSIYQGLEELKNDQLRMAVIDRYRSDGNTTYNILKTTYPGYLLSITDAGVNDQDFEEFCRVLDSLMTADDAVYGTLDQEDPFFVDSIDVRMYRAYSSIMETEESSSSALKSLKSAAMFYDYNDIGNLWGNVNTIINKLLPKSDPAVVAEYVLLIMFFEFDQGDIIKRSVKETYLTSKGVILLPTVTTEFTGSPSSTSVTLQGYVIEDGGGAVTSRGIAWADFYNPTTNDQTKISGTGLGTFSVTLSNLIEGNTYYSRTFATNGAGTAYGNCLTFIAGGAVGIDENEVVVHDFNVYPNPASALTTFSFNVESSGNFKLTIINLKGQAIYSDDLGSLPIGDHQINLDLSSLGNGIYTCQLMDNGKVKGTRKLVISR
jgi:hypothetical protein